MTDQELGAAIVAYLHHGSAASPRADAEAAAAAATSASGADLVARVRAVVAESLTVPVDREPMDLGDAGHHAAAETAARNPGLSAAAQEALAWNVSFAWR